MYGMHIDIYKDKKLRKHYNTKEAYPVAAHGDPPAPPPPPRGGRAPPPLILARM